MYFDTPYSYLLDNIGGSDWIEEYALSQSDNIIEMAGMPSLFTGPLGPLALVELDYESIIGTPDPTL